MRKEFELSNSANSTEKVILDTETNTLELLLDEKSHDVGRPITAAKKADRVKQLAEQGLNKSEIARNLAIS